MPVSRMDFDRGRTELSQSQQVLTYLNDHPDQAYTANEISNALKPPTPSAKPKGTGSRAKFDEAIKGAGATLSREGFRMSLDFMVLQKKLSAKRVKTSGGKTRTYYTLPRPKKSKS